MSKDKTKVLAIQAASVRALSSKYGEFATIKRQTVLTSFTNLESLNAVFIRQGLPAPERLQKLNEIAISQMRSLLADHHMKRLAL